MLRREEYKPEAFFENPFIAQFGLLRKSCLRRLWARRRQEIYL